MLAFNVLNINIYIVTQNDPVALYVASHPYGVWLVGPMAAALTGEQVCQMRFTEYTKNGASVTLPALSQVWPSKKVSATTNGRPRGSSSRHPCFSSGTCSACCPRRQKRGAWQLSAFS